MAITLYDYDLSRSGLHISYNDTHIDLDAQQTCELFLQCGLISDYKIYDGDIVVWFRFEDESGEVRTTYLEYPDYVMFTTLTESVAKVLVTKYELINSKKFAA